MGSAIPVALQWAFDSEPLVPAVIGIVRQLRKPHKLGLRYAKCPTSPLLLILDNVARRWHLP